LILKSNYLASLTLSPPEATGAALMSGHGGSLDCFEKWLRAMSRLIKCGLDPSCEVKAALNPRKILGIVSVKQEFGSVSV
jgi:hypothetical protein